jgi:putative salt-induced outer membrane protein YdiY
MKKILMVLAMLAMATSAVAAEKKAAKTDEAAKNGFKTTLSAGVTLTDGNSETLAANAGLVTEGEKKGLGSVIAGMEANYGESTVASESTDAATGETTSADVKQTTVNNAKAYANVKKTLSPRTFASLDGSLVFDDVALIDYRATVGPGLGVYLVKNDKRSLTLEAGPSYVWEKVDNVSDDYLALRFAERYSCQISKTAKLVQSLAYAPEASDFESYLLTGEAGVEAAMTDRVSLRVVLQDKYDSTPAVGAERNDLSLIAGLGFTL